MEGIDLTGLRFGKLLVVSRYGLTSSGNVRWMCACDCGQQKVAVKHELEAGKARSCPQCSYGLVVGERFGKLTVVEILPGRPRKGKKVRLVCDCGEECFRTLQAIKDSKSPACKYCRTYDLRGMTFGILTVLSLSQQVENVASSKARWECICSCGKEKIVRSDYLRSGRTKSCGCSSYKLHPRYVNDGGWRQVLGNLKCSARSRGIEVSLSLEDMIAVGSRSCHYCGGAPSCKKFSSGGLAYSGLDRIDSEKGYHLNNVVACCKTCNFAKNTLSYDEFRKWVARAYTHMFKNSKKPTYSPVGQLTLAS